MRRSNVQIFSYDPAVVSAEVGATPVLPLHEYDMKLRWSAEADRSRKKNKIYERRKY